MDTIVDAVGGRRSRTEQVYVALREELMAGRVSAWERLTEERLAEMFQVSRTPVREALARLLADGSIEKRDGGYYTYMPRFDQLEGLYELRVTLELAGIDRVRMDPSRRHDTEILGTELSYWYELRDNPPEPDAGFVTNDEGFHVALLDSAGNPALTEALTGVNQRIRPVRMYDYLTDDRMTATVEEHIAIAEAVRAMRIDDARSLLEAHICASRDVVIERAARALQPVHGLFGGRR
ncbi:GntR family transcriptional regulator [Streptomyces massasporeus]|uniref:GntR family transcriptional regulator n=1 Tax=Streptomyces massasporeus TaxID=67324 RepID=UPI0036B1B470